uniref:Uncharacterized protein n=1 Tax=Myotis myotis TaxID=51298 RepID=A0A7J7SBS1_MYOMY|nr:hypothetical protein mMyoMyo1_009485 [Myotis myotis]
MLPTNTIQLSCVQARRCSPSFQCARLYAVFSPNEDIKRQYPNGFSIQMPFDPQTPWYTACLWRQRKENTPNVITEERLWIKYNNNLMFKRIVETELDMSKEKWQVTQLGSTVGFSVLTGC